jgi:hypothetical protein
MRPNCRAAILAAVVNGLAGKMPALQNYLERNR